MESPTSVAEALFEACGWKKLPMEDFVGQLSIEMFSAPSSMLLYDERLPQVSEPMRTALATLLFDTELQMVGMVTLLGNSAGLLLPEFIRALRGIGAAGDAKIVEAVTACLARHGLSPRRIREGAVSREEFAISTTAADHPHVETKVWDEIAALSEALGSDHGGLLVAWLEAS